MTIHEMAHRKSQSIPTALNSYFSYAFEKGYGCGANDILRKIEQVVDSSSEPLNKLDAITKVINELRENKFDDFNDGTIRNYSLV